MAHPVGNGGRSETYASPVPIPYPSPAMRPAYAYTSQEQDGSEQYRAPQENTAISLPPLNLPPIRSIEGMQLPYQQPQQQSQQSHQQSYQGEGLKLEPLLGPGGSSGSNGYYQQDGQPPPYPQQSMHLSHHHPSYIGYPQNGQGQDQRMLASTRHKKEIKRRTKTGCLTCRKRRIKCDEAHPVCRNCQKSKRECAGYDPIFRQSHPSPGYPSPSLQSLDHQSSLALPQPSQTSTASSTPAAGYSPVPQGYTPASEHYHHNLINALRPPLPPLEPHYGYNTSLIDPALGSAESTAMPATTPYDPVQHLQPNVKPAYSGDSLMTPPAPPLLSAGPKGAKNVGLSGCTMANKPAARKLVNIEDLYMIGGVDPSTPKPSESLSAETSKHVEYIYSNEYGRGFDQVLETDWYNSHGLSEDAEQSQMFAGMLEKIRTVKENDYEALRMLPSIEAKTVWSLLTMCRKTLEVRTSEASSNEQGPLANHEKLIEVNHRLAILEKLLTGQVLESNPLAPQPNPVSHIGRQRKFWHLLGQFVSIPSTEGLQVAESVLSQIRQVLDELEGRDVLYSIAIVRHIGAQVVDFPATVDGHYHGPGNAAEEKTKLRVAKKFIEDEAAGKGTNQVIQRLCGMAVRSWGLL